MRSAFSYCLWRKASKRWKCCVHLFRTAFEKTTTSPNKQSVAWPPKSTRAKNLSRQIGRGALGFFFFFGENEFFTASCPQLSKVCFAANCFKKSFIMAELCLFFWPSVSSFLMWCRYVDCVFSQVMSICWLRVSQNVVSELRPHFSSDGSFTKWSAGQCGKSQMMVQGICCWISRGSVDLQALLGVLILKECSFWTVFSWESREKGFQTAVAGQSQSITSVSLGMTTSAGLNTLSAVVHPDGEQLTMPNACRV